MWLVAAPLRQRGCHQRTYGPISSAHEGPSTGSPVWLQSVGELSQAVELPGVVAGGKAGELSDEPAVGSGLEAAAQTHVEMFIGSLATQEGNGARATEQDVHAARDDGELEEFPGVPDTQGEIFVVNRSVPVLADNTFEGWPQVIVGWLPVPEVRVLSGGNSSVVTTSETVEQRTRRAPCGSVPGPRGIRFAEVGE